MSVYNDINYWLPKLKKDGISSNEWVTKRPEINNFAIFAKPEKKL